jgi:hypothetical protein
MPNWCDNYVEFTHDDPAMIDRVVKGFTTTGLFTEFDPCPQELVETIAGSYGDPEKDAALQIKQQKNVNKYGSKDWYDWCVNNWGTKWDVNNTLGETDSNVVKKSDDGKSVTLGFSTAWSPPTSFYATIADMFGFQIKAYYYESGCAFCGYWSSDGDDDTYEVRGGSEWVRNHIPRAIDDHFAISENMQMWEEEEETETTKEEA